MSGSTSGPPRILDPGLAGSSEVIGVGLLETAGGVALVDPGPASSIPGLRRALAAEGLGLEAVEAILLTHIHLDHAGATGSLLAAGAPAEVWVHARGAPHLIDPSRLLASARSIYGSELEATWGEVRPVPERRVNALEGGETVEAGGRPMQVLSTPGHAAHHLAWLDPFTGTAFVGDLAGVRLPGASFVLPVTPPPDVDLEAWERSVAGVRAWDPERLCVSHFGLFNDPARHLGEHQARLAGWGEAVRRSLARGNEPRAAARRFADGVLEELATRLSQEDAERYVERALPTESWFGLARYWQKGGAGKPGTAAGLPRQIADTRPGERLRTANGQ